MLFIEIISYFQVRRNEEKDQRLLMLKIGAVEPDKGPDKGVVESIFESI